MFDSRHLGALLLATLPALSADPARLPQAIPPELHAFAVAPNGAIAFAEPRERGGRIGSSVTIRNVSGDEKLLQLNLRLRDLIWIDDGRLLAVGFRAERRTRGEAFLLSWEPGKQRFTRVMRLPPTARDLARGTRPDVLLLTAHNELRVITLPLLRSGPLYRVLGENRAAVTLGERRVLVGQSDALLLIDLGDRQSREQMPVRERLAVDSPVEQLSTTPERAGIRVQFLDGSVRQLGLNPLRFGVEQDDGLGADPPTRGLPLEVPSVPLTAAPGEPAPIDDAPAAAQPLPGAPPPPSPATMPVDSAAERAIPPPALPAPPAGAATPGWPGAGSAIHGQLTGPALVAVSAVVAFGPDSLLREAARVAPSADGRFDLGPLPTGRYRVQLEAGGGKLLVSQPAFRIVDVTDASSSSLGFRVLQAQ